MSAKIQNYETGFAARLQAGFFYGKIRIKISVRRHNIE